MSGAHAQHHDYHLVNPSPWPLVGSFGAFIMAIGAIDYMNDLFGTGFGILLVGTAIVLYTMIGWWRDVIREAEVEGHHTPVVQLHLRYGMMLFIASEVMFFVAWFWAYFGAALWPGSGGEVLTLADGQTMTGDIGVLMNGASEFVETQLQTGQIAREVFTDGHWPPAGVSVLDPWHYPLLNTLILLTSGTTVTWAHHALLQGNRKEVIQGLWLTVILGLFFTSIQAYEYSVAPFSFAGNIYGATFFMATGFHGFHVIIGTIFLFVCLLRAYAGHFKPDHHFGFEAAAWYWHFVDVVWLFLFASIYVFGSFGATIH